MTTERKLLSSVALLYPLALAGCAGAGAIAGLGAADNWGEANRQTMAAQVIDPTPQYDYLIPETSAEHAAQAIERYREDRVKLPDRVPTSDAAVGGGPDRGN